MPFSLAISTFRTPLRRNYWVIFFFIIFILVWANSLIGTTDIHNWILENVLTILFISFLILSFNKYQFSDLSYLLICIYLCLHVYGSKYTYAENSLGYYLQDVFQHLEIITTELYIFLLAFY